MKFARLEPEKVMEELRELTVQQLDTLLDIAQDTMKNLLADTLDLERRIKSLSDWEISIIDELETRGEF